MVFIKESYKYLILVVLCLLMFSLLGCGGPDELDPKEDGSGIGIDNLTIVSGPTSGLWYPMSAKIGEIIERELNIPVTVDIGNSMQNLIRVDGGQDADMGLVASPEAYNGYNGLLDEQYDNIAIFAIAYPSYLQVLIRDGANINTWKDFVGKRYCPGGVGTGGSLLSQTILEEAGVSLDDVVFEFGDYGAAIDNMKDGIIDAVSISSTFPYAAFEEYLLLNEGYFLATDEELANRVIGKYPAYSFGEIPAGTYDGQDEAVPAFHYPNLYIVRKDLPEEVVYEMTKALFENLDEVHSASPTLKSVFTLENALYWKEIPVHPGAQRYYEEVGAWE